MKMKKKKNMGKLVLIKLFQSDFSSPYFFSNDSDSLLRFIVKSSFPPPLVALWPITHILFPRYLPAERQFISQRLQFLLFSSMKMSLYQDEEQHIVICLSQRECDNEILLYISSFNISPVTMMEKASMTNIRADIMSLHHAHRCNYFSR